MATPVLSAARDLQWALDHADADVYDSALAQLSQAASAFDAASAEARFEGREGGEPATATDDLEDVLGDLAVAQTFISAAAVARPGSADAAPATSQQAGVALSESLADLSDVTAGTVGPAAVARFEPPERSTDVSLATFQHQLSETITDIVQRTGRLGRESLAGCAAIPGAIYQPLVGAVVAAVPEVTMLVRAGLKAVRRAVANLLELIPENLRKEINDWVDEWWKHRLEQAEAKIAHRVLAAGTIEDRATTALSGAQPAADRLRQGLADLTELGRKHAGAAGVIEKVIKVLRSLLTLGLAFFAAAAVWLSATAVLGFLAAIGVAIWLGRDYLDTGAPFERVPGAGAILDRVAG